MFIRKAFFLENNLSFLPGAIYEDAKFYFDAMILAERVKYIPEKLHFRLYRCNSIMTTNVSVKKIISTYRILTGMLNTLVDKKCVEILLGWLYFLAGKSSF
jgi:heptose III glucuronosyltransferase